jgi:transcriptional regulator with XRE-family HTH domain
LDSKLSDISKEEVELFYKQVSKNVKEARVKANVSQMELALRLGIKSIAFYSNCENTKYNKHFNLEHIYKISKALNIDMCKLLTV